MSKFSIRAMVRQVIAEAKDTAKKDNKPKPKTDSKPKPKTDDKKPVKKESQKLPKSSGKLIDLKKELVVLNKMKDELQTAKFAEKTAFTEVEFADLQKFATELDKLRQGGVALETSIDAKISEIETRIADEKTKIKEMIGLTPAAGQKKIEDVKKTPFDSDEDKGDVFPTGQSDWNKK